MILEVCVDSIDGLRAAIDGGADRIELCSALELGGLTPSIGLMSAASREKIVCYAMIRPRSGSFVYSEVELLGMAHEIAAVKNAGLAGVVLGASLPDGRLDPAALGFLCSRSVGLGKTLHRAFDLVPDLSEAVELAIDLGFERILTSGRAEIVSEGLEDLRKTRELAGNRIIIMPGSGVNAQTIEAILKSFQDYEFHASCSSPKKQDDEKLMRFGFSSRNSNYTDIDKVRRLKAALQAYSDRNQD